MMNYYAIFCGVIAKANPVNTFAPDFLSEIAQFVIVDPLVTISSTIITFLPFTSDFVTLNACVVRSALPLIPDVCTDLLLTFLRI